MTNINVMVDVEADGPCPGLYSMTEIGAIVVDNQLDKTFYGKFSPISPIYKPEALAVTGYNRADIESWPDPQKTMWGFDTFLNNISQNGKNRLVFWSDNNGFDWQFVNYYFHKFLDRNPFGHSSNNLANLYGGLNNKLRQNFNHLRIAKHSHNPLEDALGNAQAMLQIINQYKIEI